MDLMMALQQAFDTGLKTGMSKNAYDKFNFWWNENMAEVIFIMGGIIAIFAMIGTFIAFYGMGMILQVYI
jgi:hypothetical protein